MNIKTLNQLLVAIAEKRMELGRLTYADKDYDDLEEELHNLEDEFVDHYGKEMEIILKKIHQKYCPDTEVLSPISYLAKNYIKIRKYDDGTAIYSLANSEQGLIIDSDHYETAHLVIVPNPVKILLTANAGKVNEEVWIFN